VAECRRLVAGGVKEITLLGQTINSYCYDQDGRKLGLASLLKSVHEIAHLKRLRFVTSYPHKFDERILDAMAQLPRVCEYLHIPAQSGSDRVLERMKRHYTARQYLDLIGRARETVADVSISGDLIVGFCGETEEDFEASKELLRCVRYKNCFIFRYSPRPGTQADSRLRDDVPDEVKKRRHGELLELQNAISLEDNQCFVGNTVEILVEGPSKKPHLNQKNRESEMAYSPPPIVQHEAKENMQKAPHKAASRQLVGRTRGDHIVVFYGDAGLTGKIVQVQVVKASALTLFGELVK